MSSPQPLPPPDPGATLTSPELSEWLQEDMVGHWLPCGPCSVQWLVPYCLPMIWLIFLSRSFVSTCLLFAIPDPHLLFKVLPPLTGQF